MCDGINPPDYADGRLWRISFTDETKTHVNATMYDRDMGEGAFNLLVLKFKEKFAVEAMTAGGAKSTVEAKSASCYEENSSSVPRGPYCFVEQKCFICNCGVNGEPYFSYRRTLEQFQSDQQMHTNGQEILKNSGVLSCPHGNDYNRCNPQNNKEKYQGGKEREL